MATVICTCAVTGEWNSSSGAMFHGIGMEKYYRTGLRKYKLVNSLYPVTFKGLDSLITATSNTEYLYLGRTSRPF